MAHSPLDGDAVRHALVAGQPRLVFEPIADLRDLRVIGVEALPRFDIEPPAPPDAWFEAARRVGLGVDLEVAAVRRAATTSTTLPTGTFAAVKVSPATAIGLDLAPIVEAGVSTQLVLELPVHASVGDYPALRQALRRLRGRGVRLAIGGVGAGSSPLRHVLRLAPDLIKLHEEVTRGVDHDAAAAARVGGLVAAASAIGALVVAAGIASQAQLAGLRDLGVQAGQGCFIGGPSNVEPG